MDAKIYQLIKQEFSKNSSPILVKKYQKYFKEGYDAYGVDAKTQDEVYKKIIEKIGEDTKLLFTLCQALIKNNKYEEVFLAQRLIKDFEKSYDRKFFKEIEAWYQIGIRNWAHTDNLCGSILPIFLQKKIIKLSDFDSWKKALNKYQRRSVPVTLIKIIKEKSREKDFKEFFEFIEPLMMDEERVVHQGLGWFLRECWKINPKTTEKFLLKWKNKSARIIFQYAIEKMTKEERMRFRRDK